MNNNTSDRSNIIDRKMDSEIKRNSSTDDNEQQLIQNNFDETGTCIVSLLVELPLESESVDRGNEIPNYNQGSGLYDTPTETESISTPTQPITNNTTAEENTSTSNAAVAATDTTTATTTTNQRPNRYFLLFLIRITTRVLETVWLFSPIIFFLCLFLSLPTWVLFAYLLLVLLSAHVRFFCVHRLSTIDHTYSMSRIVSNLIRRECTEIISIKKRNNTIINSCQIQPPTEDDCNVQDKFTTESFEISTATKKLVFSQKLLPRQSKAPKRHRFFNWKSKYSSTNNIINIESTRKITTDLELGHVVEEKDNNENCEEHAGDELNTVSRAKVENNDETEESDDEVDDDDEDKYDVGEGCDKCIVEWLCGVQRKLTCPCCRNDYYYEVKIDHEENNQRTTRFGWLHHQSNNITNDIPNNNNNDNNNDNNNNNNNNNNSSSNNNNNNNNSSNNETNTNVVTEPASQ
jgi:hypothetical protein